MSDSNHKMIGCAACGAIQIKDSGERGIIESIAGGRSKPVGFVVNCPVVYRIN